MPDCSVGFIFDSSLTQVLLVHKKRPAWQAGLLNGIGGKVEPGESTLDCMVRECQEETALDVPASNWLLTATIKEPNGDGPAFAIDVFTAQYPGSLSDAKQNDHENIEWFPHHQLPDNVISNLHFLIPLAHQKLLGHGSKEILIKY